MNPHRKFHQEIIRLEIAYVKIHSYEKLASQQEAFCRTQKLNAGTLTVCGVSSRTYPSGAAVSQTAFRIARSQGASI